LSIFDILVAIFSEGAIASSQIIGAIMLFIFLTLIAYVFGWGILLLEYRKEISRFEEILSSKNTKTSLLWS
jgi:hypothetical protein